MQTPEELVTVTGTIETPSLETPVVPRMLTESAEGVVLEEWVTARGVLEVEIFWVIPKVGVTTRALGVEARWVFLGASGAVEVRPEVEFQPPGIV